MNKERLFVSLFISLLVLAGYACIALLPLGVFWLGDHFPSVLRVVVFAIAGGLFSGVVLLVYYNPWMEKKFGGDC